MANAVTRRTTARSSSGRRYEELGRMLEERQRELAAEVHVKLRGVRADGVERPQGMVFGEATVADLEQDIDLALIQMKAETLERIEEARARLAEDRYGLCFECGDAIAEARLRALPFAIRCKECEEAREIAVQRERMLAQRRGTSSLFADARE